MRPGIAPVVGSVFIYCSRAKERNDSLGFVYRHGYGVMLLYTHSPLTQAGEVGPLEAQHPGGKKRHFAPFHITIARNPALINPTAELMQCRNFHVMIVGGAAG